MGSDKDLARALVYLLLQVAWADDEVTDEEINHVIRFAAKAGFPDEERGRLESFLRGDAPCPPPDFGYLRQHREQALVAVGEMIAADDSIIGDEKEVYEQIQEMLA